MDLEPLIIFHKMYEILSVILLLAISIITYGNSNYNKILSSGFFTAAIFDFFHIFSNTYYFLMQYFAWIPGRTSIILSFIFIFIIDKLKYNINLSLMKCSVVIGYFSIIIALLYSLLPISINIGNIHISRLADCIAIFWWIFGIYLILSVNNCNYRKIIFIPFLIIGILTHIIMAFHATMGILYFINIGYALKISNYIYFLLMSYYIELASGHQCKNCTISNINDIKCDIEYNLK